MPSSLNGMEVALEWESAYAYVANIPYRSSILRRTYLFLAVDSSLIGSPISRTVK
jgi:hypothetical protein